jgi:hypothetical protein
LTCIGSRHAHATDQEGDDDLVVLPCEQFASSNDCALSKAENEIITGLDVASKSIKKVRGGEFR